MRSPSCTDGQNRGGVPRNYAEVVKWFRMSAEQGHAEAQFLLGVMYREGEGVPQDFAEAQVWFNLAAAQGHRGAKQVREIVAKRMTREWMERHQQ
jgi:TPR repeat protein